MKRSLLAIIALMTFTAFTLAEEILQKLGLSEDSARYSILANLTGNFSSGFQEGVGEDEGGFMEMKTFRLPYLKNLKSVVNGDKIQLAKDACTYVKMYVSSKEFLEDYRQKREACKPTSEPWRPDAATIKAQKDGLAEMEKAVAEMKKSNQMTPEMIKQVEEGIIQQRKQIEESEDPTPNKTKWEKDFPEDPSILVKRRLEEFIRLSETVDFKATLTAAKKFTNPVYEKKSYKWKAIFRAGSEVNAVAKNFASTWLKEGIKMGSASMPVTEGSIGGNDEGKQEVEKKEVKNEVRSAEKKGGLKSLKNKAKGILN